MHPSQRIHTCTRARGASSVVVEVVEEGRRHISSLILLLKFLSLLSRHRLSTTTITTNFNPTQTQLQPTTKNFIIFIMGGCDCTSSCGCASSESCTCVSSFFSLYHQQYLSSYSRFIMMMMMLITLPLCRRSRRLEISYYTNYQQLVWGDGDGCCDGERRGEEVERRMRRRWWWW